MNEITWGIFLFSVTLSYFFIIRRDDKKQVARFTNMIETETENILYDAPTSNDKIGFEDYASVLANYINDNKGFMVYGIYGPWGSGKTSLMKMVQAKLCTHKSIWFDAWKFKGRVSIFDALCHVVGEELSADIHNSELKKKSKNLLQRKAKGSLKINYSVKDIYKFSDNMNVLTRYLNENKETKIVIFVDDLDRCNPSDAMEFLESLKVFYDVPRINFVIGVNYDILYYEINKRYKDIMGRKISFAEEYLAKIVNIPFYIPALDKQQIENYIQKNIQIEEVLFAKEVFSIGLEGNLRTIKRVVNSFIILLDIAKIREIEISPILLAKIMVIQYRYIEIYNKILLQPEYLLELQSKVIHEDIRYKKMGASAKEIDKLPLELKKILKIRPYFEDNSLNLYINLSQDGQNEIRQNRESKIQNYLMLIKDGKLTDIPDLRMFEITTRRQVIDSIKHDFKVYNIEQQLQAIKLLGKVFSEDIHRFFNDLLDLEKVDFDVKSQILLLYSDYDVNIEKYVWRLLKNVTSSNHMEQQAMLLTVVNLLKKGNRVCIDVLEKMFDKIDLLDCQFQIKADVVRTLGESGDKKAIDLIVRFLKDVDIDIIHIAFDAIAQLDVNALLEWYDIYTINRQYRGPFLEAISKHAQKGDLIINEIRLLDMVQLLKTETDEKSQIAEIKILYLVTLKELDNYDYFAGETSGELIKTSINCLSYIARYDEKWQVRKEAEQTKEELIKRRDESFL